LFYLQIGWAQGDLPPRDFDRRTGFALLPRAQAERLLQRLAEMEHEVNESMARRQLEQQAIWLLEEQTRQAKRDAEGLAEGGAEVAGDSDRNVRPKHE
jgi:hypothetical protein